MIDLIGTIRILPCDFQLPTHYHQILDYAVQRYIRSGNVATHGSDAVMSASLMYVHNSSMLINSMFYWGFE